MVSAVLNHRRINRVKINIQEFKNQDDEIFFFTLVFDQLKDAYYHETINIRRIKPTKSQKKGCSASKVIVV